jgi:L-iditol 2-dehydrogenase
MLRVAKIISPKKIDVTKEPVPEINEGNALVRLLKTVICGSDLPYFNSTHPPTAYPFPPGYPGHECLGIVEKSEIDGFLSGDLVMYYPPGLDGYKEYHVTGPERLQKIPSNRDLNVLVMTQLLGAVSHCAFRIDRPYNKTVVVMGQGPVGLLFTALLKNFGSRTIIAVDPLDYRLQAARDMGAGVVVNPARQNIVDCVAEVTGGDMADIVIDAYGQDVSVINQCFDLARHNGQVAFFGICLEESPRLCFNTFFRKELRMVASVGPDLSIDYPFALDMILRGAIDVTPLITHVMRFEEIQKGFETAAGRLDNVIKVVLEF